MGLLASRRYSACRPLHVCVARNLSDQTAWNRPVTRLHHCRLVDFRCGKRLGKGDHIVEWLAPAVFARSTGKPSNHFPSNSRFVRLGRSPAAGFRSRTYRCYHVVRCRVGNRQRSGGSLSLAGMRNSICGHSSKRCRWISYVARRQNWYGRDPGSHSGLQPHPHHYGSISGRTLHRATNNQP